MILLLFALSSALSCYAAPSGSPSPQAATIYSLEYGLPIAAWERFVVGGFAGGAKPNVWYNNRQIANSNDTVVVKLNVDTLYSTLYYDLSANDIEVTIPEVPGSQFKLFSFFDVFGENYVAIGTGGFYEPGTYLLTPQARAGGKPGLQTSNQTSDSGKNKGTVTAPLVYGAIVVRWLVNQTNIDVIHRWQDETGAKTISRGKPIAPSLTDVAGKYSTSAKLATNIMDLIPYYIPTQSSKSEFTLAGIDFASDKWSKPKSVDLEAANATALQAVTAAGSSPEFNPPVGNGWSVLSPTYMGMFGTEYAFRSYVASNTYLGNPFPYSLYPSWTNTSSSSGSGTVDIPGNDALLFTFSGLPLLKEAGFWSLTLYNGSFVLINNPLNRYSLGDRSNLTYPDGKPVYFGSANFPNTNSSGPFQILVQPSNVKPPSNWTSNWLPAPSGGGEIVPELRWYNAEKAMFDGGYVYPKVEKIAAIRG